MHRPIGTFAWLAIALSAVACGSGDGSESSGCTVDGDCAVPAGALCQVATCDPATATCGTAPAADGAACEQEGGQDGTCQAGACGAVTCVAKGPADGTCDGVDDDCDGQVDDDFAGGATTCGVGVCSATGQTACVDGVVSDSCHAGTPAASDATCDGKDDDCDGAIDDDFEGASTACGAGACASTGALTCSGGEVSDSCQPGTPAASDTICDGKDDDCDGATDEAYVSQVVACGEGACQAEGTTTCVGGQVEDSCSPAGPGGSDAVCNGIDDDCDGATDEDFAPSATTCGVGACAAQGQTACVGGVPMDGCQPGTPATVDATCDGIDDDCDGSSDDDVVATPSSCGVGACATVGTVSCLAGSPVDSCAPGAPTATDDLTCDGVDDDCDGEIDEQFVATPSTCGAGECAATGEIECVDGQTVDTCLAGFPGAGDASCNGLDDDCDGATDEDYAPSATTCGAGGCAASGELTCEAGAVVDTCAAGSPAFDDATCDGVDDDCDGATDEEYAPSATACGVGACAAVGQLTCASGVEADSCSAGSADASDATCDGADDDCDGQTDEEYAPVATACGVGACEAVGELACQSGVPTDTCAMGQPAASDATCDAVDDDCDGQTDEAFVPGTTDCGVGACQATGTTVCQGGVVSDSCSPGGAAGSDAVCNGIDDDCDGQTDEDYVSEATTCGVGACVAVGSTACTAGAPSDSCTPGAPAASDATCDGIDDDCNGTTDEDYEATSTACGVGACARSGTLGCVSGGEVDSCAAGTPAASDATCNDLDDDCNGQVDEDYVAQDTSCGVGACARTGRKTCGGGIESDSCAAGTPAASDATCDNVDDDCNGSVDEAYLVTDTTCGVGACASAGQKTCAGGVESDSCTAGVPAPSDASCNAVDDNCNGQTDEGYVVTATACGVGACASVGQKTCAGGVESDSCVAGTPAASDASCNAVDDDCNGQTDEGYVVTATACGVGACASAGQKTCAGGVESDSCTAGTPAASDTSCNAVDDNCNGQTDEGYVVTATACGVGACASAGQKTCGGGVESDSCVAGDPAPTDTTCNAIDDNCNGQTDEGYVSLPTTCGTGHCAASGATSCPAGLVVDSCTPGAPLAETCNGLDDNCDGQTDEASSSPCGGTRVCVAMVCYDCYDTTTTPWDGCDNGTIVEMQVNTTADFIEWGPAVAALTDGGYVVTWSGTTMLDPMTFADIVAAQHFTSTGEQSGPELTANSRVSQDMFAYGAAVAGVSSAGFLATWTAPDAGGTGTELVGRVFSSANAPASADFVVVPYVDPDPPPSSQRLASTPGTHVVQVWQQGNPTTYVDNTWVRLYQQNGAPKTAATQVLPPDALRSEPAVDTFSDGSFVVVWTDDGTYAAPSIGVKRYQATGGADGADFAVPIDDPEVSLVGSPGVATFGDGSFVVVLIQNAGFGNNAVIAQLFDATGAPAGVNVVVGTDAGGGVVSRPQVTTFANGNFAVAWTSAIDGDGTSVSVRFFDANGDALTVETLANTYTDGDQGNPAITTLKDETAMVVWDSCWWGGLGGPQDGVDCGVYAQRFSSDGAKTHR